MSGHRNGLRAIGFYVAGERIAGEHVVDFRDIVVHRRQHVGCAPVLRRVVGGRRVAPPD
jgi:hypothetical protein